MSELLLGCGHARDKRLALPGEPLEWTDLVTLDNNPKATVDVFCDLDTYEWSCRSITERGFQATDDFGFLRLSYFHEVHAYEVLEHLGHQGSAEEFFSTFANIHRILRPGGHLFATVPSRYSAWLWGDPSHRRVICAESLAFLSQEVIAMNRRKGTAMSDFSALWDRDFKLISMNDNHQTFRFCLQAIK